MARREHVVLGRVVLTPLSPISGTGWQFGACLEQLQRAPAQHPISSYRSPAACSSAPPACRCLRRPARAACSGDVGRQLEGEVVAAASPTKFYQCRKAEQAARLVFDGKGVIVPDNIDADLKLVCTVGSQHLEQLMSTLVVAQGSAYDWEMNDLSEEVQEKLNDNPNVAGGIRRP